jgi:hypothetical protein
MSWQEAVVEAWRYYERFGKPSARKAMALARSTGAKFRNEDGFLLLEKFRGAPREQSGSSRGAVSKHAGSSRGAVGEQSGSAFARANKVLLVTKNSEAKASVTPDSVESAAKPAKKPSKRKAKDGESVPFDVPDPPPLPDVPPDDPSQPQWVREMRAWVPGVVDKSLAALASKDRLRLARYHAWRWANCTRDGPRNLKAAARIVVGLTTLATHPKFGSMSVRDYIAAGDAVWDQTGRAPIHNAWIAISQLE